MSREAGAGSPDGGGVLRMARSMRAVRTFTAQPVDDAVLTQILDVARWAGSARNRQPWHWTVCRDTRLRRELSRSGRYAGFLTDAPVIATLSVDPDAGGADAEFDCGRAAQQLLVAADAVGLGACPVTLDPDRAPDVRALLGLDPRWTPRWAIALGHPAPPPTEGRSAIPRSRRALDDVVTWR
jgi:nitroreductase